MLKLDVSAIPPGWDADKVIEYWEKRGIIIVDPTQQPVYEIVNMAEQDPNPESVRHKQEIFDLELSRPIEPTAEPPGIHYRRVACGTHRSIGGVVDKKHVFLEYTLDFREWQWLQTDNENSMNRFRQLTEKRLDVRYQIQGAINRELSNVNFKPPWSTSNDQFG